MFARQLGILCALLLTAGCASSGPVRSLAAAAGNPAVVERNFDGTVTLRSARTHVVSVLPLGERFSYDVWGLPAFYAIVTNGARDSIRLQRADIAAVIRPGEVGGGRIILEGQDILSGVPLKIVVTVAGEKHEFLFEVRY